MASKCKLSFDEIVKAEGHYEKARSPRPFRTFSCCALSKYILILSPRYRTLEGFLANPSAHAFLIIRQVRTLIIIYLRRAGRPNAKAYIGIQSAIRCVFGSPWPSSLNHLRFAFVSASVWFTNWELIRLQRNSIRQVCNTSA